MRDWAEFKHRFLGSRRRKILSAIGAAALLIVLIDGLYLILISPNWSELASGLIPKTRFIHDYENSRQTNPKLPKLRWQPVDIAQIPENVQKVFLAAEDAGFYQHGGVDFDATWEALVILLTHQRIEYGASTITQQTVKNLLFTNQRSFIRKWHEFLLALRLEQKLTKKRILAIYLNSVEFGLGIYGVEAAAQTYWGISAANLSIRQAAELAASLPSPKAHNPQTRTKRFLKRTQKILGFVYKFGWEQNPAHNNSVEPSAEGNPDPPVETTLEEME